MRPFRRRRNCELEAFEAFVASQQAMFELRGLFSPGVAVAARSMRAMLEREGLPLWPSMLDDAPSVG